MLPVACLSPEKLLLQNSERSGASIPRTGSFTNPDSAVTRCAGSSTLLSTGSLSAVETFLFPSREEARKGRSGCARAPRESSSLRSLRTTAGPRSPASGPTPEEQEAGALGQRCLAADRHEQAATGAPVTGPGTGSVPTTALSPEKEGLPDTGDPDAPAEPSKPDPAVPLPPVSVSPLGQKGGAGPAEKSLLLNGGGVSAGEEGTVKSVTYTLWKKIFIQKCRH